MTSEYAKSKGAELAEGLQRYLLHLGENLEGCGELPRNSAEFADTAVRSVLTALADSLATAIMQQEREEVLTDAEEAAGIRMPAPPLGLSRCYRCRRRHGSEVPPMGWFPLIDAQGEIWGVICPDCRVAMGDETITLKIGRPWSDDPGAPGTRE